MNIEEDTQTQDIGRYRKTDSLKERKKPMREKKKRTS